MKRLSGTGALQRSGHPALPVCHGTVIVTGTQISFCGPVVTAVIVIVLL